MTNATVVGFGEPPNVDGDEPDGELGAGGSAPDIVPVPGFVCVGGGGGGDWFGGGATDGGGGSGGGVGAGDCGGGGGVVDNTG